MLPKYAREFYENTMDFLTKKIKIKRETLESIIKKTDIDGYMANIVNRAALECDERDTGFLGAYHLGVDYVYSFNRAKHFCVKSLPKIKDSVTIERQYLSKDSDIIIDFRYKGIDYFMCAWERTTDNNVDGVVCHYNIILYSNRKDVRDYNAANDMGVPSQVCECMPMYKVGLNRRGNKCVVEIPGYNFWMVDNCDYRVIGYITGSNVVCIEENDKALVENNIPTPNELVGLLNHVMYCYQNRNNLTRKADTVSRHYDKCEVYVKNDLKDAISKKTSVKTPSVDTYVPLRTYVHEYNYISKGGTHASPVEHERSGFYRRSRGKGDYIVEDGKYVYVGGKKGDYSYVAPTHVNGRKKTGVTVYKV